MRVFFFYTKQQLRYDPSKLQHVFDEMSATCRLRAASHERGVGCASWTHHIENAELGLGWTTLFHLSIYIYDGTWFAFA